MHGMDSDRGLCLIKALAGTAIMGLCVSVEAHAQTGSSHSDGRSFDIPAQSLPNALTMFGKQAGVQVSVDAALLRGLSSQPVSGKAQTSLALQELLKGTNLTYRFLTPKTVYITKAASASDFQADASMLLETIDVSGETGNGPVEGYRATRTFTGTKTDTPLRDIPQSIQVVSRDLITDRQTTSLADALQTVSSVQQSTTAGNRTETYRVRGFSSPGYAIDGVMLNAAKQWPETFLDLANVERVEVLKGPASVLYGRGQPGGLINIVTRQPTTSFQADGTIQAGGFGFVRSESSVSGALNTEKTLTARLTAAAQTEQGFIDERIRSERQFGGLALRWEPLTTSRIMFNFDYTHQRLPADRGLIVTADNRVSLPRERFLGEKWAKVEAQKTRLALRAEHEFSNTFTSRGSLRYDDGKVYDTPVNSQNLLADQRSVARLYNDRRELSQNIDAQFEGMLKFWTWNIPHTVLNGYQYTHSRIDFRQTRANLTPIDVYSPIYGAPMLPAPLQAAYSINLKMAGVFLQDQIEFTPQWKGLVGIRYDHAWQRMDRSFGGQGDPQINDGAVTTRGGLVYQPIEPLSLYASYSESFVPQSGTTRDFQPFAPETGWQIEAGVKADLIPDRLSLTASVFQITKSNVATTDPLDSNFSVLTGKQRVRGAELDVSGDIMPGWRIVGSAAYLDARIAEDEDYAVGNRLVGVPVWSGSIWSTYEFQSGMFNGFKLGGGVQVVGARKGDLDNSFSVDGYYRFDAMASYKLNEHLDVSIVGRNLTDETFVETPVSRRENYQGAPRSVLASLKARF